jgi:anti-sigma factor RsiW
MMTCKEIAELLLDYLDGELPKEYRDMICQHIRLCGPCLHYVESYQVTVQVSRRLPPIAMPQHLLDRLQAALKEIEGQQGKGEVQA